MCALTIDVFLGVHDDPRCVDIPIHYAQGSYIPHAIPASFEYIYIIVRNTGSVPCIVQDIWFETSLGARCAAPSLQLPPDMVLQRGACCAVGFLRHLFTNGVRHMTRLTGEQHITAHVSTKEAIHAVSRPLCLSLDYPTQPLEDVELLSHAAVFLRRGKRTRQELQRIQAEYGSLQEYAGLHTTWGVHRHVNAQGEKCWRLREYMPAASHVWLTTDKIHFQRWAHHAYQPCAHSPGWWELILPASALEHGTYMELRVASTLQRSAVRRVPAMAHWVEQDAHNPNQWCARLWDPPQQYVWQHTRPANTGHFPRIYEAHVGMAQASLGRDVHQETVGSYADFAKQVLPRIKAGGYTAVQLMGVPEHPLYKSFGYQVSSYFAPSSRFGTPDDFKALVDAAHGLGLAVILDIAHSHSCPNTEQGIAQYDTSHYLFSPKENQWGTLSFDYAQEMTRRFLLSNCRSWLEEYQVDGFRFDAVGNMIYVDHGFGDDFSHPDRCFYTMDGEPRGDEDGILYLGLANALVREICPAAVTIAEEFSGMPGITSAPTDGGLGFDFRFAMGIPDFWAQWIIKGTDTYTVGDIWHEMTNHRRYDNTISYMECHDQSINGKDAMIWRIIGDAMYNGMGIQQENWLISRGIALYKMMRLVTLATAHKGYLNFMGAEFGHPEWLDEAEHAHRQWHLADDPHLKYSRLAAFDRQCLRHIVAEHMADFAKEPLLRLACETTRILAFERGCLLFVFNFHETDAMQSPLMVTPGKYVEMESTDAIAYGGYDNLTATGIEHFSDARSGVCEQRVDIYLPPLTALILQRM